MVGVMFHKFVVQAGTDVSLVDGDVHAQCHSEAHLLEQGELLRCARHLAARHAQLMPARLGLRQRKLYFPLPRLHHFWQRSVQYMF
ncbi:hypothetical protein EJB05_14509, partial [Eragrostis curvula]